jgi:hypothetical protein
MAGILAWAADVVGGAGGSDDEADDDARAAASAAMTPAQRLRAADLDARAASLRRAIQDLRLRVPPPHVAQRLPHLHADSLASSAALALQLNAHSSTKEQVQNPWLSSFSLCSSSSPVLGRFCTPLAQVMLIIIVNGGITLLKLSWSGSIRSGSGAHFMDMDLVRYDVCVCSSF